MGPPLGLCQPPCFISASPSLAHCHSPVPSPWLPHLAQDRYLATGGADALACLWDARDGICLRSYYRSDYPIRSLSFSHNSRYLSIAGDESGLDIENVETGASLGRLALKHSSECAAWNPRRLMLAFCGEHGTGGGGGGGAGAAYGSTAGFGSVEFRWRG